ncbi:MAG: helix-turn-helix transcriptional regulator [Candidatus Peribacteraceae bacterium]|nr:helix-turn-helix transcriptional regulator [Candidatus Peribacteraceae bacterium]
MDTAVTIRKGGFKPERLYQLRVERGYSLEKTGSLCKLSTSEMGQLENGKRNPGVKTIAKMAKGFKVEKGYFFA